jgi:hypothetical protein
MEEKSRVRNGEKPALLVLQRDKFPAATAAS